MSYFDLDNDKSAESPAAALGLLASVIVNFFANHLNLFGNFLFFDQLRSSSVKYGYLVTLFVMLFIFGFVKRVQFSSDSFYSKRISFENYWVFCVVACFTHVLFMFVCCW